MYERILNAYARLMCRLIWAARRIFPAKDGPLPDIKVAHRHDFEWSGKHECENCGKTCRHKFITWVDDGVTTAECSLCGLEATIS
jgi:hypothetical protein